jgi:hypothetical protein
VRTAILVGAVIAAVLILPGSASSGRQKPYVLTALAATGTVYWRYDCVHYRAPEVSLGVRVFSNSATTTVSFRAGKLKRLNTLQPGGRVTWFPFRRNPRQRLTLVQRTEPRTLHASVIVWLGGSRSRNCQPYMPPRFTATVRTSRN